MNAEPIRDDPLVASSRRVALLHRVAPSIIGTRCSRRTYPAAFDILFGRLCPRSGASASPYRTVAFRSAAYRKSVLKVSDARISLVGEIVDGIKTVKLNSLDAKFRARVEALRAKELASIRQALTLNAYNQVKAL